jgi:DNA processing protein
MHDTGKDASMSDTDRLALLRQWLTLLHCPRIGAVTFDALLEIFGSPAQALAADAADCRQAGLSDAMIAALAEPDTDGVQRDLDWLQAETSHHIVLRWDPEYPALLRECYAAPPLLYIKGDPDVLALPQLAMVGSRNPTREGLRNAQQFAAYLAGVGLVVTSGLAIGIDGAAHRGALEAGGMTVAVTGTGLDRVYPARHRELAYDICQSGALVSEFPVGTPSRAEHFPRRNRLISGLSLGTLVVEAALRSGSLITARYALEQGREVFAIPGSIHNPLARGTHRLLRDGARLVETASDITDELAPLAGYLRENMQVIDKNIEINADQAPEHVQLLNQMGYSPVSIDDMVDQCGLTAEQVCSMMLFLELQGCVASNPDGCYVRVK